MQEQASGRNPCQRRVVITGAGKGLGRAFALAWGAQGAAVLVNNRTHAGVPSTADETVAAIRARGGTAEADYSDLAEADAPARLIDHAVEAYGGLDAVILNAGAAGPVAKLDQLSLDDLAKVMALNFSANAALLQAALPHLRRSADGRILFVASTAGLYGLAGRSAYAASKGALIALALSLARELRRAPIRVNVLAPYAATQMTPEAINREHGDLLTPDQVAPAAVWLTSADCRIHGQIWVAGGGAVRRARVEEGAGCRPAGRAAPDLGWVGGNLDRISDMADGKGFDDAEAAFADLLAFASSGGRRQEAQAPANG